MYGGPKIVCFIRRMIQVASQNIAGLCDSSACTFCKVGFLNVHILVMLQADFGVNVGSEEDSHRVDNIWELNLIYLA